MFEGRAGRNLRLYSGASATRHGVTPLHGGELEATPVIGDDVSLGSKASLVGAITVGSGTRVGFNAVVERDLAPGSLVFSAHIRAHLVAAGPGEAARAS